MVQPVKGIRAAAVSDTLNHGPSCVRSHGQRTDEDTITMLLLTLLLQGCQEAEPDASEDTAPESPDEPAAPPPQPTYLEPQLVGFEYTGGWDEHRDALEPWAYSGLEYEPYVRVIFATEYFFTTNNDDAEYDLYFCEVLATLEGGSAPMEARHHEDGSPAELRGSYVGTLSVFGYGDGDCENLDPERWPGGEARWAVDGMPLGFGIGSQTDFLATAWSPSMMDIYGDYMLSGWFAYERPASGGGTEFVAHDWTNALLWKWDAQTGELLLDKNTRPLGQSTSDTVLSGWLSSYAYFFDEIDNIVGLQLIE